MTTHHHDTRRRSFWLRRSGKRGRRYFHKKKAGGPTIWPDYSRCPLAAPGLGLVCRFLQERQDQLRTLVRVCQDGSSSLHQDLLFGEVGDFLSEVRVTKYGFRVYGIFQGRTQVICGGFQRVFLEGTQTASPIGHLVDGGVDDVEGVLRLAGRSDINIVKATKLIPLNGNAERDRIHLANPERSRLVSVCSDLEYQ